VYTEGLEKRSGRRWRRRRRRRRKKAPLFAYGC